MRTQRYCLNKILFINCSFKDYELRLYEKNKYAIIKLQMFDESSNSKKDKKSENDPIMKSVWKLMKYTQGIHNAQ